MSLSKKFRPFSGVLGVLFLLLVTLLLNLLVSAHQSPEVLAAGETPGRSAARKPRPADIILGGKLFCSLKRTVSMPFRGIVTSVKLSPGQPVKEGEVLVRYRLLPDVLQQIRRRLAPPAISEFQSRLADLDKNIAALDIKLKELRQLVRENMASSQSLENVELERQLLARQRASALERLQSEKQIAKDDAALLKEQLGKAVNADQLPQEASLLAPIAGHIIGIHSDVQEGAELPAGTPAVVVGVLDPIVMRTQVHEIEAVQIGVGDEAEVSLESFPARTFKGTVSRLSWSPLTPGVDQPSYYELLVTVPNPDLALIEGLKGQVVLRKTGS